jgi:hypothetical protein
MNPGAIRTRRPLPCRRVMRASIAAVVVSSVLTGAYPGFPARSGRRGRCFHARDSAAVVPAPSLVEARFCHRRMSSGESFHTAM